MTVSNDGLRTQSWPLFAVVVLAAFSQRATAEPPDAWELLRSQPGGTLTDPLDLRQGFGAVRWGEKLIAGKEMVPARSVAGREYYHAADWSETSPLRFTAVEIGGVAIQQPTYAQYDGEFWWAQGSVLDRDKLPQLRERLEQQYGKPVIKTDDNAVWQLPEVRFSLDQQLFTVWHEPTAALLLNSIDIRLEDGIGSLKWGQPVKAEGRVSADGPYRRTFVGMRYAGPPHVFGGIGFQDLSAREYRQQLWQVQGSVIGFDNLWLLQRKLERQYGRPAIDSYSGQKWELPSLRFSLHGAFFGARLTVWYPPVIARVVADVEPAGVAESWGSEANGFDGFHGVRMGEELSKHDGLVADDDMAGLDKHPDRSHYHNPDERLILGKALLTRVRYRAYQGKCYSIQCVAHGKENCELFLQAVFERFHDEPVTPPLVRPHRASRHWMGRGGVDDAEVVAEVVYDPIDEIAGVTISDVRLEKEVRAAYDSAVRKATHDDD